MRRGDVASTSAQRHFYVMCQLGLVLCNLEVKQLFLLKTYYLNPSNKEIGLVFRNLETDLDIRDYLKGETPS